MRNLDDTPSTHHFVRRLRIARLLASGSNDVPGLRAARRWLLRRILNNSTLKVSSNVRLDRSHAELGGVLTLGQRVELGPGVCLDISGGIAIGDDVTISQGAHLLSHNHGYESSQRLWRDQGIKAQPLVVGRDVWIGTRAIILGSTQRIGQGAIVAAGAVVTRSIPDYAIVAGVPARVVATRSPSS